VAFRLEIAAKPTRQAAVSKSPKDGVREPEHLVNRDNLGGSRYIIRRSGKEITLDDFQRANAEKAVGDRTE
jgi:hypothetical protein